MPLSFPSNPTIGQTYQSGSSPTYRWGGTYWDIQLPPVVTTLNAVSSSLALSASFAQTASYFAGGGRRVITKISQTGYNITLVLAEGRLFAMKGNEAVNAYPGALNPSAFATGLNRGALNAYEIEFPGKSGSIVDADTYGHSAYALFDNGDLFTWGRNAAGQLGLGNLTDTFYPSQSNANVTAVYTHRSNGSSDPNNTRLLIQKTDGKIYGCGENSEYELGLSNNTDQSTWQELTWAGTNPLSVWNIGSVGGNIFVQRSNGEIWGSGRNTQGQLGNSTNTTPTTGGVLVDSWRGGDTTNRIIEICAGHKGSSDNDHITTMLLRNTAGTTTILSSGYGGHGGIGNNSTSNVNAPTAPSAGQGPYTAITSIASVGGSRRTLYAQRGTTLLTWGNANYGQGGWQSTAQFNIPLSIGYLPPVLEILPVTQGWNANASICASALIRTTSGYFMSGYATGGALGAGTTLGQSNAFIQMRFPGDVVLKFVGCNIGINEGITYYGVDTENKIWCWGFNAYNAIDPANTTVVHQPVCIQPTILLK